MAFVLRLTDGSDTIDFMDLQFQLEDGGLQITPPEEVQTWTDPSPSGGASLVDSRLGNRTVTVTFHVAGANRSVIRQGINRINALMRTAREHSLGRSSTRVTFQYAWDDVDVVDNFEVLAGKLILPDDVMSVEKIQSKWDDLYRLRGCQLEMTVSPNAYGLSPSTDELIELPLSNRNGTDITNGIYIRPFTDPRSVQSFNHYIDNYVDIKGSDIQGDAPAKLRIEMAAWSSGSQVDRVVIGAHEKHAGQMQFHWADPKVEMLVSGTSRAVDYAMGGSIWRSNNLYKTWTGKVFRIKLTSPEVYGSKKYRVFMSTGYWPFMFPTRIPMRLQVENEKGVVLAQGPIVEQYFSSSGLAMIQDLGVVQLPPHSSKLPDPQDIYLVLYVVNSAAYDFAMTLNHVWLVPVENGYRYLKLQQGVSFYHNSGPNIVDDYWNNVSYISDFFYGSAISAVQSMYSPIVLYPGKDQRIYFNFFGHNYIPYNGDMWLIRVFYSPAYTGAV